MNIHSAPLLISLLALCVPFLGFIAENKLMDNHQAVWNNNALVAGWVGEGDKEFRTTKASQPLKCNQFRV